MNWHHIRAAFMGSTRSSWSYTSPEARITSQGDLGKVRRVTSGVIALCAAVGLTLLTACTPSDSAPAVTVTQISTVTRLSPITQPAEAPGSMQRRSAAAEPELCAGIRAQQQVNQRLAGDGYGAAYEALLRSSGCTRESLETTVDTEHSCVKGALCRPVAARRAETA